MALLLGLNEGSALAFSTLYIQAINVRLKWIILPAKYGIRENTGHYSTDDPEQNLLERE